MAGRLRVLLAFLVLAAAAPLLPAAALAAQVAAAQSPAGDPCSDEQEDCQAPASEQSEGGEETESGDPLLDRAVFLWAPPGRADLDHPELRTTEVYLPVLKAPPNV